jgi:2,4-dienoyl-CoA reductase (NADPH2)
VGSDKPYLLTPAEKKKRVAVIGGGPAGMEAARVASLRGHEVFLYEKSSRLGGLMPVAALVKGTDIEDLPALIRYYHVQLNKLGVSINLSKEVDIPFIEKIQPDVVILATGGKPAIPDIPGIDNSKVINSSSLHRQLKAYLKFFSPSLLNRLTRLWMPVGKNVVIIGGGKHGCELAEFLVKRGRKVTFVDTSVQLGKGLFIHLKHALFSWFKQKGVVLIAGVRSIEVKDSGVLVITAEGRHLVLKADSIIPAISLAPDRDVFKTLEGNFTEVYSVGDCREPQYIVDAIADGWRVACLI